MDVLLMGSSGFAPAGWHLAVRAPVYEGSVMLQCMCRAWAPSSQWAQWWEIRRVWQGAHCADKSTCLGRMSGNKGHSAALYVCGYSRVWDPSPDATTCGVLQWHLNYPSGRWGRRRDVQASLECLIDSLLIFQLLGNEHVITPGWISNSFPLALQHEWWLKIVYNFLLVKSSIWVSFLGKIESFVDLSGTGARDTNLNSFG
jgi:hypothetical protein